MASVNDVKSAEHMRQQLMDFVGQVVGLTPAAFQEKHDQLLFSLQFDLSTMAPTPVVGLAAVAIERRDRLATPG